MLKTIRLYGDLGRQFGRVHHLDVSSALDAVRAMCALHPGFKRAFGTGSYKVILDRAPAANLDELKLPSREIKFVPAIYGAGHGLGEVFLGALLIVASFYIPGLAAAGYMSTGAATALGGMAMSFGMTLVMGGIGQLLSNSPQQTYSSTPFSGPVNTSQEGNPVPILYGRLMIGSQVISASLQSYDISTTSNTTSGTTNVATWLGGS